MTYFDIKGSYYGGKAGSGVYQQIINQIPPHHAFISGCLGYGGIIRHKRPAAINCGFDLDMEIIKLWNGLKPPQGSKWQFEENDILYLLETIDEIGNPIGTKVSLFKDKVFLYLDPPYLLESRADPRYRYNFEFFPLDHQRLFASVRTLQCNVAISHYPTSLYDKLLEEGWRYIDYKATTRQGAVIERLYMNYPVPNELHDYSYLGDNYKERERIKLKFDWWKKQPFDLDIPPTLGNCDNCWKKSTRILVKNAVKFPDTFDWRQKMVEIYQDVREIKTNKQSFFRGGATVEDIFQMAELSNRQLDMFDSTNRLPSCGESCEVY